MAKKVADQLVDTLEKAGVRRIYAVTGDSLNEVNEAVRKNGRLRWIHVRHEETGAYAAAAEAQLTGELACCAGSSGDRKSTRLNSSHRLESRMPSSA